MGLVPRSTLSDVLPASDSDWLRDWLDRKADMEEIFRTGYVGGAVPEAIEWQVSHTEGAKSICVPFAGIGRQVVAVARPDTVVESWDTMHYTYCILKGVFSAKEVETNVDGIHYRKGWMFKNRSYKHIDDRCAGFIDWVAEEGTLYDKAALGSAMTRSTLMGRMMHWHTNIEGLYSRFQRQFEYNRDWLDQPGRFAHHEGDFFERDTDEEYDLLMVDPPKVVNYSDVYSLHFAGFNMGLTGGTAPKLPKWSRRNALRFYRRCLDVKAPNVIFMYTSKVIPDITAVERMLSEHGTIKDRAEFYHNGKTDYGFYLERS
jgi:hypothetical protein